MPRSAISPRNPAGFKAGANYGTRKGNTTVRYLPDTDEAIWSEELQAALLEALAVHPPMGKQRVRYPYGPDAATPNKIASLGRCQLIQHYLKEKTGKMRTRKQIASRLQRLRRIHKNDPKMMELLQVLREPVKPKRDSPGLIIDFGRDRDPTPTQETFDMKGMVLQHVDGFDPAAVKFEAPPPISLTPFNEEIEQKPYISRGLTGPAEELNLFGPMGNADRISDQNSSHRIGDGLFRSSSWEAPSMSRRRLASNMPALHCQVSLPPALPGFHGLPPLAPQYSLFQPPSESPLALNSAQRSMFFDTSEERKAPPITPVEQILHTPDQPPEMARAADRKVSSHQGHKRDRSLLPADRNISPLAQYDLHSSSLMSPLAFGPGSTHGAIQASFSVPNYFSLPPSPRASVHQQHQALNMPAGPLFAHWHDGAQQPIPYCASRLALRLPRRLSYSNSTSPSSSGSSGVLPSPRAPSTAHFFEDNVSHAFGNLELASPVSIRPYLMSELSYATSEGAPSLAGNLNEVSSVPAVGPAVSLA